MNSYERSNRWRRLPRPDASAATAAAAALPPLQEERRRVRALLREAESRCRGLEDQVEESRARERRAAADAEGDRRRAAAEAGEFFFR